jgi:hypothetical protein
MNSVNTSASNKLRYYLEEPLAVTGKNGVNDIQDIAGRETRVREQLARRGYRLMNRDRRGEYWLMHSKPATLGVLGDSWHTWIGGNARGTTWKSEMKPTRSGE